MSEVFSSEQVAPVLESALRVWQEARGNVQLCTLCEKGSEPGGQEVERWILKSAFFCLSNASDKLDILVFSPT